MDFDERERVEFLLKTIEMIMGDAEREANPDGGYVDFETGNLALAELRQLLEASL